MTTSKVLCVSIPGVSWDLLDELVRHGKGEDWLWLKHVGGIYTSFWGGSCAGNARAAWLTGRFGMREENGIGRDLKLYDDPPFSLDPTWSLAGCVPSDTMNVSVAGAWGLGAWENWKHPVECGFTRSDVSPMGILQGTHYGWQRSVAGHEAREEWVYSITYQAQSALRSLTYGNELVVLNYSAPCAPWQMPPANVHTAANWPPSDKTSKVAQLQAVLRTLRNVVDTAMSVGYTCMVWSTHGGTTASLREENLCVPLWVGGRDWRAGAVLSDLVCAVDLMPWILNLMGVDVAPELRASLDGKATRAWSYAEWFPDNGGVVSMQEGWSRAIRDEEWKLVVRPNRGAGGEEEFYNLGEDEREAVDLLRKGDLDGEALEAYGRLQGLLPC